MWFLLGLFMNWFNLILQNVWLKLLQKLFNCAVTNFCLHFNFPVTLVRTPVYLCRSGIGQMVACDYNFPASVFVLAANARLHGTRSVYHNFLVWPFAINFMLNNLKDFQQLEIKSINDTIVFFDTSISNANIMKSSFVLIKLSLK